MKSQNSCLCFSYFYNWQRGKKGNSFSFLPSEPISSFAYKTQIINYRILLGERLGSLYALKFKRLLKTKT
ncbi:MAG: hypothetical protein A3B04_01835 [Candidatus Portnoybacteria bacterium RIFCSPLOWO2_02_FULL_39_11]|uniref:Uncharacterized protein n=1 Tax=Candidatus Portnoybacteria bacterium RIFCSPLOWO2_02_FULL_39_11 TaxID=1802001 RepID=A0A1G2FVG0_9BACT|nr:MAG: hypothetical protein A3B04_01835 [Candidatus Portnoybacteria bacterium RIFCSPLOWO2_02_FULL_39_11]